MGDRLFSITTESRLGTIYLTSDDSCLLEVSFQKGKISLSESSAVPELLHLAVNQLEEYFTGERTEFTIPLKPVGTEFQKQVWKELEKIPFGHTITYADLARRIGSVTYTRAVGLANGANPIAILIPCHRIIGAGNKLTGYAGGIDRKKWLLQHERNIKPSSDSLF